MYSQHLGKATEDMKKAMVTEILLPFSLGTEMLPHDYYQFQLADLCKVGFMLLDPPTMRSANVEGSEICTLTGVAHVSRTCELMTLFITHLIITPSLMPQTASNSLNQFLWQEIKPLCFICDPSEELSCCYCLFFNAKSFFQRTDL